jgi:hypothetical protein
VFVGTPKKEKPELPEAIKRAGGSLINGEGTVSKDGTNWRAKFRIEQGKGVPVPGGRGRAGVAKREARRVHRERWLVCDLYRGDDINAPLKFYRELGRIRKVNIEVEGAQLVFWREVVDSLARVLLDHAGDEGIAPAMQRVEAQIEAEVKRAADTGGGILRNLAAPNERLELDPVLRRVAEEYSEEMIRKDESRQRLQDLVKPRPPTGLNVLLGKTSKKK